MKKTIIYLLFVSLFTIFAGIEPPMQNHEKGRKHVIVETMVFHFSILRTCWLTEG